MSIQPKNHIVVQGWMVTDLHLSGNDLLLYALIHGFSQEENQWCTCGLQYMGDWLNIKDKSNVRRIINRLVENNHIVKVDEMINGVKFCKYRSLFDHSVVNHPVVNLTTNNIDNVSTKVETSKEDNNPSLFNEENDSPSIPPIVPQNAKRFVKPTIEQVTAYCNERHNGIDPQHFIDYYESNGWQVGRVHMKDWKAAVRTWERKEVKQSNQPHYGHSHTTDGASSQPRQRDYNFQF